MVLVVEGEKRRKKMMWEKRKPRRRLMRQQRPWMSSQKIEAGDLSPPPSMDESNGDEPLKLLSRRLR